MSDLIEREALLNAIDDAFLKSPIEETTAWMLGRRIVREFPAVEPKTKVIAQVTFDEDKLREIVHEAVERIKEEYDIVDNPDAVSKWIPCSERLPKKDGDYLVTLHHKWPNQEYKTVEIEEFRSGGFDENLYMKIVAWTPKPEPWKGADDEVLR